ncbi:DUF4926 domain-containing protein [Micromonospora tulbaghiae]|uniref:DUF4926 domain-containing protein n=1 Tax=Micromonospora tulbaghiae TaxID=479978 RepID=A0AAW4JHU3_9ACTN|nr:DUF4926 domain-containing protein [Micromonospora tulbaghiae]MBO4141548.1 DUF4926 domain-containing protein [Micromonospora tulbaghiae]MDX5459120.1 DUF4926 domain-containing protein [Micromonospora tulbaghiae]SCF11087.1 protein of unknown function [Micromonospora tulbaghiae]
MALSLHDVVEIKEALPEENLPAGAVGTVVHVYHRHDRAYEVEFADEDGRTVSSVVLTADKLIELPTSDLQG